ncbi:uncharacterized protein LOC104891651 isoform X2 [Beta vulgaris subsp. vulgaris]|uniref:uncharacterized protein LOC104891651 isoform X2 n=1 Tax=Beta vulgaris subsp. vulgaris TaxID=3555 RepID=UPI00053FA4EE|nr:uncharacterized protein LOC104891651 isoform X2 [Beta vulgaris subsp. vulgaris]
MNFVLTQPSTSISFQSLAIGSRFHPRLINQADYRYNLKSSRQGQKRRTLTVSSSVQPVPPPIPSSSPSGLPGKGWIAGALLAFLLPFLKNKWGPLIIFKNEFDKRLQTVEDVVETLEKVADRVEHIAEDVAKDLPEGQFKKVAMLVDQVAERVESAAHQTDAAIDKFQELEGKVESYVESNKRKTSVLVEVKTETTPSQLVEENTETSPSQKV